MATAIVTSEGQTTIPKEIRELLGLQSGDRIDFIIEADGRIYLQPVKVDVETLKGILHKPDTEPVSVEQMDDAILQNSCHSLPGAFSKR
jgi:AbrB family looped-hinge helix DNA binding protein